ncbi:MAG: ParB/Srx family N-terminal domain-containing protein [Cetobacterium sp.]
MKELKIEKMKVGDITKYKNNSKKHPQWQIEQLKKSISEFGFLDPIAIDGDNVIIEGHGRLEALVQLGIEDIPVIKIEHLSEMGKRAYIIAHNKINQNTGFDIDILKEEIDFIRSFKNDFDFIKMGFDHEEMEFYINENLFKNDEDYDLDKIESPSSKEEKTCPHCGGIIK